MSFFWLSFADSSKPRGQQFLGACLVEADSLGDAIQEAWRLGINPGGEVMGFEVPSEYERNIGEGKFPIGKLLSREEATELDNKLTTRPN